MLWENIEVIMRIKYVPSSKNCSTLVVNFQDG